MRRLGRKNSDTLDFWGHLAELRFSLLMATGAFVVGAGVAHIFHAEIIHRLLAALEGQPLQFLSPLDPLFFILKVDAVAGLVLALPIILYALFRFVAPALEQRSSRLALAGFLGTGYALALLSGAYAILLAVPFLVRFLATITVEGTHVALAAPQYLGFVMMVALIHMMIAEIPVMIVGAVRFGLLKLELLTTRRRHVYLGLAILLAVATPTTDPVSFLFVYIPAIVLFEIGIGVSRMVERRS